MKDFKIGNLTDSLFLEIARLKKLLNLRDEEIKISREENETLKERIKGLDKVV